MNSAPKHTDHVQDDNNNSIVVDLPSPDTKRWVARRKAQVVYAVQAGVISLTEACERYTLSVEEFLGWQRAIESNGLPGLRATRIQKYRGQKAET